ncbi:hypothetical protein SAMD00019534_012360 [Acytostelium subglobosum LB1]|uniref:hypothetical protein n=1 Tax=Acytostelium subglobosum LB1 TaxID=1410327 RepID=UPI0006449FE4|nr:hypothetical protein SAMD00019534_012360 [Acytostelium subglobosum LB1]GAM18061.1 hypothetical protein SAMD00019534_012360 [Acytostelium subglobosum LB1]|eukprot:XP_012758657.1 hypothetical protein SAMD00019534_012360 [Acytostelium subglobosum LB1]
MQSFNDQALYENRNNETSIEFKNLMDTQVNDQQYFMSRPNGANIRRLEHHMSQTHAFQNVMCEPPRPTGFLMNFIFLFHPILLYLFVLPALLTFWVLFITEAKAMKPYFYIVFLAVPLVFQIILLIYHSRSMIFLSYGRQAVSMKYHQHYHEDERYQLVDLHSQSVVALLDKRVQDENALYLYLPVTNKVFNMTYYESTFQVNAIGHWQVTFTWKALLSVFVFGMLVAEFVLLFVLRNWFMVLFA